MGVAARITARTVALAIVLTAVALPAGGARAVPAARATCVTPAAATATFSARTAGDGRATRPRSRLVARGSERAVSALIRPLALAIEHDAPATVRSLVATDHLQPAHPRTSVPDEPTAARDPPAA